MSGPGTSSGGSRGIKQTWEGSDSLDSKKKREYIFPRYSPTSTPPPAAVDFERWGRTSVHSPDSHPTLLKVSALFSPLKMETKP